MSRIKDYIAWLEDEDMTPEELKKIQEQYDKDEKLEAIKRAKKARKESGYHHA